MDPTGQASGGGMASPLSLSLLLSLLGARGRDSGAWGRAPCCASVLPMLLLCPTWVAFEVAGAAIRGMVRIFIRCATT